MAVKTGIEVNVGLDIDMDRNYIPIKALDDLARVKKDIEKLAKVPALGEGANERYIGIKLSHEGKLLGYDVADDNHVRSEGGHSVTSVGRKTYSLDEVDGLSQ